MSGFRKAKAEQAALKMALYGPPGSGKTFTTLLLAEGLAIRDGKRIAYVDTERGTDFYCKSVPERAIHPEAFDFDALYTRSIMEILGELRKLDPSAYGVIVIDSMTHIWEAARAAYAGKQTKIGTIPMQAWGQIKKPYKDIMAFLLSSPMHVFILGRQGTDYATDEETDELKAVGLKMKAEGETAYEPHILLRMEAVKPRKTNTQATIVAYAEKDRTGVLSGRSFANPTFDTICVPLLGLLGGSQAQMKSSDEVASADAEAIEHADHQQAAASKELMRTFCARIELAESASALKKIGDGITPQIKARMLPSDLAAVREKYHWRMSSLPTAATRRGGVDETTGEVFDQAGLPTAADMRGILKPKLPPHDPETGEIISQEEALADPTGEKAVALLKKRLDERAAGGWHHTTAGDRADEQARNEIAAPGNAINGIEPPQRKDAGAGPIPPETAPASDPRTQRLIDEGRAVAIVGQKQFKSWKARLNSVDYGLVEPHLAAIEKATA